MAYHIDHDNREGRAVIERLLSSGISTTAVLGVALTGGKSELRSTAQQAEWLNLVRKATRQSDWVFNCGSWEGVKETGILTPIDSLCLSDFLAGYRQFAQEHGLDVSEDCVARYTQSNVMDLDTGYPTTSNKKWAVTCHFVRPSGQHDLVRQWTRGQ